MLPRAAPLPLRRLHIIVSDFVICDIIIRGMIVLVRSEHSAGAEWVLAV
jgi:hypothetical protein